MCLSHLTLPLQSDVFNFAYFRYNLKNILPFEESIKNAPLQIIIYSKAFIMRINILDFASCSDYSKFESEVSEVKFYTPQYYKFHWINYFFS